MEMTREEIAAIEARAAAATPRKPDANGELNDANWKHNAGISSKAQAFVVDDVPRLCAALRAALDRAERAEVVGKAERALRVAQDAYIGGEVELRAGEDAIVARILELQALGVEV